MSQVLKTSNIFISIFKICIGLIWTSGLFAQQSPATVLAEAQQQLARGEYESAYQSFFYHAQHQNNPLAQFSLGLFHQNGWSVEADPRIACYWYEKAAKGEIPTASHFMAECLQNGVHQPVDYAAALRWYLKAAELGHHISLCSAAELMMQGKDKTKNPQHALEQCRQVALAGSIPAQLKMGQIYLSGNAAVHDPKQAIVWFNYAAERGSLEAFYYLGNVFLNYSKDHATALKWFETAAGRGYITAYFPTARLYFNAPVSEKTQMPVAENLAKAYLWLSATIQVSKNRTELKNAGKMLKKVVRIMPESWKIDLDQKLNQHLATFHP
ncbi:tetratricopeptide repeat protein [Nitrosomonas marina]|uniref:TPR repeat n=1 Tax=Nitrosomonas marina TaxID=917 RepID=A0A1H8EAB4_9PROT|nr:tetratricopeptide repeat protein [Nitrosomonas marina]SEN16423.1 hypothetical protein SAMN05216325_10916 [Nitrosomonas marina]